MKILLGKLFYRIQTYYNKCIDEYNKSLLGFIGNNVLIKNGVIFDKPSKIFIEDNTQIGNNCHFRAGGTIKIGKYCQIASYVIIVTANHNINSKKYYNNVYYKDVIIGNNVWIGSNAIILPGVTISDNAVVAAGAVITKNVPENSIVAGVPAKVIRTFLY